MGIENIGNEYKHEEIQIRKFGEQAYALNIGYYNDNLSFLVSHVGMNRLHAAIKNKLKEEQEELSR